MAEIDIVRTRHGKPGSQSFYDETMPVEKIEVNDAETYNKVLNEAFAEFKKDTDIFTVRVYSTKGLVKTYSYEDIMFEDCDCDNTIVDFNELETYWRTIPWERVNKLRNDGFNA